MNDQEKWLRFDWKKIDGRVLCLELALKDFSDVVDAVNRIALAAEKLNHHPDLTIFDYNKLKIEITTHDQRKLTSKDYRLAQKIEEIFCSR